MTIYTITSEVDGEEVARMKVAERDIQSNASHLVYAALQGARDEQGRIAGPPEIVVRVAPVADAR
jgi:hypothetical protein